MSVSKSTTQFTIAIIGMLALAVAAILAVVGEVFYGKSSELTFALVTALTGTTGTSIAYFFRINGTSGGP